MEQFILDNDIHLFCVKAASFPEGIQAAHEALRTIARAGNDYYGISYPYANQILYMAAATLEDNETPPSGCLTYTLKKGTYNSIMVSDYARYPERIKEAFRLLMQDPRIDPQGCCAECYLPEGQDALNAKDVRCMIRLID